jgi:hypothetical protein
MHAEPLPLGVARSLPQLDVRAAEDVEDLEQPVRIVVAMPKPVDP